MRVRILFRKAVGLSLALGLSAWLLGCGGGGGSSSPSSPATTTQISGTVTFDLVPASKTSGLLYSSTTQAPVRGVVVEAINADSGDVSATTTTDASGNYSLTVSSGSYFIRVKAQMLATGPPSWDFQIVDNTSGQALYVMDSAVFTTSGSAVSKNLHAASGWDGTSYSGTRVAAPFAILNTVYQAVQKLKGVNATIAMTKMLINWSINNRTTSGDKSLGEIGTSHYVSGQLYILGRENLDTDEYDDHVVAHEWGHYFEDRFSRSDSLGGSHSGGKKLDPRVAFGEGFGNAISGMILDSADYIDTSGSRQATVGVYMDLTSKTGDPSSIGWYSEDSVQYILYALYKQLGFQAIYDVMTVGEKTTKAYTTIYSFIYYLKENYKSNSSVLTAINDLLTTKKITTTAVDEWDSTPTETNDPEDSTNTDTTTKALPVYVKLTKGTAVSLCVDNDTGNYNSVRTRRYIYFNAATAGNYTVAATRVTAGGIPNITIVQQGVSKGATESTSTSDISLTLNLSTGDYVGEVYDYRYLSTSAAATGEVCYDVTLNY